MASEHDHQDRVSAVSGGEDAILHDPISSTASSDGEGAERTTREKLKKTSIAGLHQHLATKQTAPMGDHPLSEAMSTDDIPEQSNTNGLKRGRPSKKRSFEDLQKDDPSVNNENSSVGPPNPKSGHHKRMRSRDISNGEQIQTVSKYDEVASPLHEESDVDAQKSPGGPGILIDAPRVDNSKKEADRLAEERILLEEDTTNEPTVGVGAEPASLPSTSVQAPSQSTSTSEQAMSNTNANQAKSNAGFGFSNASAASPFGVSKPPPADSRGEGSEENAEPTNSAFASSGLSAFAASEKSPFGASNSATKSLGGFGSASGAGFGGGGSGFATTGSAFGVTSPFGAKGSSGFGTSAGFGSTGGFGGSSVTPKPFGSGVSTFAGSGGAPTSFAKGKPFGASKEKNDDEEGSDDGEESNQGQQHEEEAKPDSRFTEQDVETGEEDEETVFSCRAKLYHFEKEWKERGVGTFKINIRYEEKSLEPNDAKDETKEQDPEAGDDFAGMERKARMIMRTDGVHRVILNSPIFKSMNVGTQDGQEPSGRTMFITGLEDGKPRGFQIKIGKEEVVRGLYHKIQELKADLI